MSTSSTIKLQNATKNDITYHGVTISNGKLSADTAANTAELDVKAYVISGGKLELGLAKRNAVLESVATFLNITLKYKIDGKDLTIAIVNNLGSTATLTITPPAGYSATHMFTGNHAHTSDLITINEV